MLSATNNTFKSKESPTTAKMPSRSAARVAILTDIHGNVEALEAVLTDAAQHAPDLILFGGDLVMNGPRPAETLARVIAMNMPAVIGNTDDEVLNGEDIVGAWTQRRLSSDQLAYLRWLPLRQRITPPGMTSPQHDLLIVHSTPRSFNDVLILTPEPIGTIFTEATPLEEAAAMLDGAAADLITYGHIHYFSEAVISGQRVMSIGAVGFPFDGDTRAAYAIAQWDGAQWLVEQHRVTYDHEGVIRDLAASDIPFP
jgi:predicted phosphodiesterase